MKDKNKKYNENKKNTTKYGEFVCSNYQWLPLEIQKEQAKKMENITNEKEDEQN